MIDVSPQPPAKETYIGDGVYASFDGWQIWLRTPRESGVHEIALEPRVFGELAAFARSVWSAPSPGGSREE